MGNPISHWELMVSDVARTRAFYGKIFDWKFNDQGSEYTLIDTGTPPGGGLMARPPGVARAALNTYFAVNSIDATLRKVVEAGGNVIVPRTEVPGIGWFAMFLDPDQIAVGLWEERKA